MGSFFTNIHIRAEKVRQVDTAIKALPHGGVLRSKPSNGWVSIYDETADTQDVNELRRLVEGLSKRLQTVAIAFLVHDSSNTIAIVCENGEAVGELRVGSLASESDNEEESKSPDAESPAVPPLKSATLLRHARAGVTQDAIEALLGSRKATGTFTLEDDRVQKLAELLGISAGRATTGFNYLVEEDGAPVIPGLRRFEAIGRQSLGPAVARGNSKKVREQLAAGADPNEPDIMALAMTMHQDDIVTALLDAGADLAAVEQVLLYATSCAPALFRRILDTLKSDINALNWATYGACGHSSRTENLHALLTAGAQPNVMIDGGITPLMSAASWRNLLGVRVLLDAGARADVKTPDGRTAADFAKLPLHSTGTYGVNGSESDVPAILALLEAVRPVESHDKLAEAEGESNMPA